MLFLIERESTRRTSIGTNNGSDDSSKARCDWRKENEKSLWEFISHETNTFSFFFLVWWCTLISRRKTGQIKLTFTFVW